MLVFGKLPGVVRAAVAAVALCNFSSGFSSHIQKLSDSKAGINEGRVEVCFVCHKDLATAETNCLQKWNPISEAGILPCFTPGQDQGTPMNPSLLCLSCHDNVVAPPPPTSDSWFVGMRILGVLIDESLQTEEIGHHPIGTEYLSSAVSESWRYAVKPICDLPLYRHSCCGDLSISLECPTCHDPHSRADSYLRITLEQHELCHCCHEDLPQPSRRVYLPIQKEKEVIDAGKCLSCHNR